jgi:hypothetical protein
MQNIHGLVCCLICGKTVDSKEQAGLHVYDDDPIEARYTGYSAHNVCLAKRKSLGKLDNTSYAKALLAYNLLVNNG